MDSKYEETEEGNQWWNSPAHEHVREATQRFYELWGAGTWNVSISAPSGTDASSASSDLRTEEQKEVALEIVQEGACEAEEESDLPSPLPLRRTDTPGSETSPAFGPSGRDC